MTLTLEPHARGACAPGALSRRPSLRVLAFVEARGVTGAVKNLLQFHAVAAGSMRAAEIELVTYWRAPRPGAPGAITADVGAFIAAARAAGIATHVLHERHTGDPRLLPQLRALVRRLRPDIVETHHVKSHFLAAVTGGGVDYPWIAFHHGYTATSAKDRVYSLLDRWSLRRATAIVTVCRAFAEDLARAGITRPSVAVVHSAASTVRARECSKLAARARLNLPADAAVVLSVGRLSREKAHAQLVKAFAERPLAAIDRAMLVIAGDGPERGRLERLAARLDLNGRVRFAGYQADVSPYYEATDVVALPSDSEGSPNTLLEAMAAGRPVVATAVGGVPDIIEHDRTGLLVAPRDPAALARALATVVGQPFLARALAREARTEVERRFTPEGRAAAILDVYRQVCPR